MLDFLNPLRWLWVSFFVVALDQWSKWFVVQHLIFQKPYVINKFFNLYLDHNIGAAFSFLHGANGWQVWMFAGIALIVSLVIVIYLIKNPKIHFFAGTGLALILGGAVGNLIDRISHHYVIDFIQWHVGEHYWPTFNIADSAVCVGVVLFLLGNKKQDFL